MPQTQPCKCREFCLILTRTGKEKESSILMTKASATGSLLTVTTAIQGHTVLQLIPCTHKEITFHFCMVFPHTAKMTKADTLQFCYICRSNLAN